MANSGTVMRRMFSKKEKAHEFILDQLRVVNKLGYQLTDEQEKEVEHFRDLFNEFVSEVDMKIDHIYLLGNLLEEAYKRGNSDGRK